MAVEIASLKPQGTSLFPQKIGGLSWKGLVLEGLEKTWDQTGGGEDAPLGASGPLFPSTQLSSQDRADNLLERSGNWLLRP